MAADALGEKRALPRSNTQQQGQDPEAPMVTNGFVVPDLTAEAAEEAPPAYGDNQDLSRMQFSQPGFAAGANVNGKYLLPGYQSQRSADT